MAGTASVQPRKRELGGSACARPRQHLGRGPRLGPAVGVAAGSPRRDQVGAAALMKAVRRVAGLLAVLVCALAFAGVPASASTRETQLQADAFQVPVPAVPFR